MSDQTHEVLESIIAGIISVGFVWLLVTAVDASAAEVEYTLRPVKIELLIDGRSVLGECEIKQRVVPDRKDTAAEKRVRYGSVK